MMTTIKANVKHNSCVKQVSYSEYNVIKCVFNTTTGPPRIRRPYVQYGMDGQAVNVECIIDSIPTPTKILWFHNSRVCIPLAIYRYK